MQNTKDKKDTPFWAVILFMWVMILMAPPFAFAAEPEIDTDEWKIPARIDTQIRASNDRTLNITEYFKPLWQDPTRVVFGTARIMGDNQSNVEGSLGLGARALYTDHIWGGYIYADRRFTALESEFWQGTAGVEYIKENVEARANMYVPTRRQTVHTTGSATTPILVGTGVYTRGTSTLIEEAQPGIDAEIGFKIPDFSKYVGPTRVFGGGYYFKGDVTEDVAGGRVRMTTDVTSWARVGARAQYDEVRGGQYFIELTLRWPGTIAHPDRPRLWSRLGDTPERDVDIVTVDHDTPAPLTPLIDQNTNAPARFIYVDNSKGTDVGDGTAEHPFTKISDAISILQPHDTVFIQGDGAHNTPYTEGVVVNTNHVTLHGSGVPFMISGDRYALPGLTNTDTFMIHAGNVAPIMTNDQGNAITLTGDTQTVRGIHVDGNVGAGIMVTGTARNSTIDTISSTGNGTHGIVVFAAQNDAPMTVSIRNSLISGNLLYGILAEQTDDQKINLNLGDDQSPGANDIYGNITGDIYANTPGGTITQVGNYTNGTNPFHIVGPSAGAVYNAVPVPLPFHNNATPTYSEFSPWVDNVDETAPYESPSVTLSGFTGSRFIAISAMDFLPAPEWTVNNAPTGSPYAHVRSGDSIQFNIAPHPTSLYTRLMTLTGPGFNQFIGVQTR